MQLRPYQSAAVEQLQQAFAAGKRAPLLVLPTGGGKTVIFTEIARRMAAKGNRCCILVHRQELLMQSSRSLREMGVAHGLIAPGWKYRGETIAVASVQTLASRIKKMTPEQIQQLLPFRLLIVDEGHHIVAGQWDKIIAAMPWARQLPVTATPNRADGRGLGVEAGGPCDHMVKGPSIAWLIEQGYLTKPLTYAPPTKIDLANVHTRGGDYNAKELSAALDKPTITGDAVAHYARLCPFKPAIVFCASVEHAEHVAGEFRAAGFVAKSVDGSMADGERRACISGLADGSIHVLTSCNIISEGTDIPVVFAAIMLRPTQSESLYLQQGGRALRPVYAPGFDLGTREGRLAAIAAGPKPRALILDHVGNCMVHGFLEDDRDWTLAGAKKRAKGEQEQKPRSLRQCPSCYAFGEPAPRCLVCGHVFETDGREVEQVAGELKPLSDAEIEAIRARKAEKVERHNIIKSLEDAFAWGVKKNYKNPKFWAKHYASAKLKQNYTDGEVLSRWSKWQTEQRRLERGF